MNFSRNLNRREHGFPLASMADIMFLMVIFLLAVAAYSQLETKVGITVPTVDSSVSGGRQPGEIIVNVDEAGTIFVNDTEMSPERLEGLLSHVAQSFADQPVIIRADAATDHQHVMGVLDICRKVDIWNVAFAALKPRGGEAE